jgi:ABC-type proline/glycine betaine transport system substrate-binding protein
MKRSRLRRAIKKAEYIALGFTMVSFMYAAMLVNTFGSKKRKEWI